MAGRAAVRYRQGHPRSDQNYRRGARLFVSFMVETKADLCNLQLIDLLAYLEYLVSKYAPTTVPIYFSYAKTYLQLANRSVVLFSHKAVSRALLSISKDKTYVHKATEPLTIHQFNKVLASIPVNENSGVYIFAFSLLLASAWRRSNIAPYTSVTFDPHRNLTRSDVRLDHTGIHIRQKWAKNMQGIGKVKIITICHSDNKRCIPCQYKQLLEISPTFNAHQPLLVFPATGITVTSTHLAGVWAKALDLAGISRDRHSLHCIRKTSVTLAAQLGAPESAIMDMGLWNSMAYKRYVTHSVASTWHSKVAGALD